MSILSGFFKTKKYRKTSEGYKLQSEWTSADTVEMADGNTAETNLGAINGITDSLTATSSNVALSAKGGNNLQGQIDTLNSNLSNKIDFAVSEITFPSTLGTTRFTPPIGFESASNAIVVGAIALNVNNNTFYNVGDNALFPYPGRIDVVDVGPFGGNTCFILYLRFR